jgi:hypothetical protein
MVNKKGIRTTYRTTENEDRTNKTRKVAVDRRKGKFLYEELLNNNNNNNNNNDDDDDDDKHENNDYHDDKNKDNNNNNNNNNNTSRSKYKLEVTKQFQVNLEIKAKHWTKD